MSYMMQFFLTEILPEVLQDVQTVVCNQMQFQYDGAPVNFYIDVCSSQDAAFTGRWNRYGGSV